MHEECVDYKYDLCWEFKENKLSSEVNVKFSVLKSAFSV